MHYPAQYDGTGVTRRWRGMHGDYFQDGLLQDQDNDDRNSNISNDAEDCVNMLEVELSHGNLCNPQLQFQQDQMEFCTHAQMVVHK